MIDISRYADSLGVPVKALKVVIMLLLCYPGAFLFRLIPRQLSGARHLFSIVFSAFLYCSMFEIAGFVQMTVLALISYGITRFYKQQPWTPHLIFFLAMGYLSWK